MHALQTIRRELARRLARLPLTGLSHTGAQRAWWRASDERPGVWAAARLARHLGGCAACRAELDPVAIERTLRLASPPAPAPSGRLTAALRIAAADGLAESARAERILITDRWTRRFVGSAVAACAAGLLLAIAIPRLGQRPDELTRIDHRLDTIEADLHTAGEATRLPVLHATLDDELGGLETTIRCLRAVEDETILNIDISGGDPCAES